jgi:uncharacterized protein
MYAATKSFTIMFSQSIALELQKKDVRIQALCPGFTRTEFHSKNVSFDKSAVPNFIWMTADEVVEDSLKGAAKGTVVEFPGWKTKLLHFLQNSPFTFNIAKQKTVKTAIR